VSDASGHQLKVNWEFSLTIYVGGTAMEYDFLTVKSLSVQLILGWDFQRMNVDTISPKTQTIKRDDGTSTVAGRSWTGNTPPAPPQRRNNLKTNIGALRLRHGVSVGPQNIQAVQVCCRVQGVHFVRERPVHMSRRNVLLHKVVVEFSPNTPRSLNLTKFGLVPVHLTKGFVFGAATAYNGPLHFVSDEEEPGEVQTVGGDTRDKPDKEVKRVTKPRTGSKGEKPRLTRRTRRTPSRRSTGRVSPTRFAATWTNVSRSTRCCGRVSLVRLTSHRIGSRGLPGSVRGGPKLIG